MTSSQQMPHVACPSCDAHQAVTNITQDCTVCDETIRVHYDAVFYRKPLRVIGMTDAHVSA